MIFVEKSLAIKKSYLFLLIIYLLAVNLRVTSQELSFGLQFKPIVPSDITNSGSFEFTEGIAKINIDPKFGTSWGAVVRKAFSEKVSFETGISYVQRNYDFQLTDLDSAFSSQTSVGLVNYEIPICGLLYVQLGDQFFLNNSLGISLDMYASDVASTAGEFAQSTYYRKWIQPALKANVGLEYRTEKSGFWYLGVTFHNPFNNIAVTEFRYRKDQVINTYLTDLNGAYLTADIRYFFPPTKGLIVFFDSANLINLIIPTFLGLMNITFIS